MPSLYDEIVRFWQDCDSLCYAFGPLFRLRVLTGQRRHEVGESPWSELDIPDWAWHLPKERAKDSKAYDIHLSDAIDGLPRIAPLRGKPAWLFSVTCECPVGGYLYPKAQVGQAMGRSNWLLDDLTRTATTSVARCGVAPHVADKVLNHISRHNQGGRRDLQLL